MKQRPIMSPQVRNCSTTGITPAPHVSARGWCRGRLPSQPARRGRPATEQWQEVVGRRGQLERTMQTYPQHEAESQDAYN